MWVQFLVAILDLWLYFRGWRWWDIFSHAKSSLISEVRTHHINPSFGPLGVDYWLLIYFGSRGWVWACRSQVSTSGSRCFSLRLYLRQQRVNFTPIGVNFWLVEVGFSHCLIFGFSESFAGTWESIYFTAGGPLEIHSAINYGLWVAILDFWESNFRVRNSLLGIWESIFRPLGVDFRPLSESSFRAFGTLKVGFWLVEGKLGVW